MNLHQFKFVQEAVRRNLNLTEAAKALVMLGGVMADPQAQAVMRRIDSDRMRSQGAVVLADQPVF